jgi:hypothetical protein
MKSLKPGQFAIEAPEIAAFSEFSNYELSLLCGVFSREIDLGCYRSSVMEVRGEPGIDGDARQQRLRHCKRFSNFGWLSKASLMPPKHR